MAFNSFDENEKISIRNRNGPNANFVAVQLLLVGLFVSQNRSLEHAHEWVAVIARYVVYILTARGLQEAYFVAYNSWLTKKLELAKLVEYRLPFLVYVAASAVLLTLQQNFFNDDFILLYTAYLVCQLLFMQVGVLRCSAMSKKDSSQHMLQLDWSHNAGFQEKPPSPTINYGTGMACSFFEGYLALVIPSDGAHNVDFVEKIRNLENSQGVVFPVKKLLIVVTKSLFCPPDLKHFNKPDRHDLPQIEACKSPEELCRSVAGVIKRRYRNTAYKIWWPDASQPPVYITAECATPLHTLYKVLAQRTLYRELCDVNVDEIVADFCSQLEAVIERSPECRGKCELVYFDDTADSEEYLPLVLLQKVADIEPQYRQIISRYAEQHEEIPLDEIFACPTPGGDS